ncbi:MAG: polyphenol oxidase family protein [Candidatus Saccharimonadales bacterium]
MLYTPINFHPDIRAVFTTVADGSIAAGGGKPDTDEHINRRKQLLSANFGTTDHSKLQIRYGDAMTYATIERIVDTESQIVVSDAAYTTERGVVIVLPVADCIATLVYDPITHMLGVLHLGRHSSVARLIEHFIIEVADTIGSDPRNWHIWMSPSLKQAHDRMDYFKPVYSEDWELFMSTDVSGKIVIDVEGHNIQRFVRAGVPREHIYNAPEDTYEDTRFFSQRAADEQDDASRKGRMMLAARLSDNNRI